MPRSCSRSRVTAGDRSRALRLPGGDGGQPRHLGGDRRGPRARGRRRGRQRARRRLRLSRGRLGSLDPGGPDRGPGGRCRTTGTPRCVALARRDGGRGRGEGRQRSRSGVPLPRRRLAQVDRIAPDSLTANARFGSAIAVGGDVALIGAPGYQGFRGAVYAYSPSDAGWTLAGRVPFEGTPQERFGSAISISGLEAWVAAPGADRFAGAVYAVGPGTGAGGEPVKLEPDRQPAPGRRVRRCHRAGRERGGRGTPGEDYGMGTAAIFERSGDAWALANRVVSETPDAARGDDRRTEDVRLGQGRRVLLQPGRPGVVPAGQRDRRRSRRSSATTSGAGRIPRRARSTRCVGRMDGTSFVDISDPANPVYLGDLPKTAGLARARSGARSRSTRTTRSSWRTARGLTGCRSST